uniref:Uncharacterized protein n=1 Tax=Parastrongyloides trichosuri TaxID=131310 RepID=A0A0N4ZZZ2_PARTI
MSNGGVEAVEEFFPGLDEHFPIQHSAFNGKCTVEVSNIDGVNQDQLSQLQQNTCSSDSSDIVKPIGTAGRKPRAMRTKKNRLLTSVTLKKLKELVSIENTDQAIKTLPCPEHSKICKRIPKRVVRVSQKMRRSDKESSLSSYDAYLTDVVNEQEELRNEMLKDEMIAIKCGREPAYRQSRYELAIFQTATIKINPLFLMARCVDCHVDTHLEQRYFNFVLPYNPVEWLKCKGYTFNILVTN